MTWFKVDDKFHSHPKVCGVSLAALGLWSKAGSWCGDHLTDGFVPRGAVLALGGSPELAAELVDAGLWVASERGWTFHDWSDHQPSGDEVRAKREAAKERMRRVRSQAVRTNGRRTAIEQRESSRNPDPDPDPDPGPGPVEESARARDELTIDELEQSGTPWIRLGKHYQRLYDAEQEGARYPRPYDEQRITATDSKQFRKLLALVKEESARTGNGDQQIFTAAAQAFLRDPKQREKGYVLAYFVSDFTRYVDRSDLEAAS